MALIINGQVIDDSVLHAEFAEIKAYYERQGNLSCCERDPEFRGYARDNIIARALLSQEARRSATATPDSEVAAAIAKLQAAHGGEAAFMNAIGGTPEQFQLVRGDVEMELRVGRMLDELTDQGLNASDDDLRVRDYYDTHLADFMTDERVRASHILEAPTHGEDRRGAFELLRTLRQELLKGADFDDAARKHSDKASEHIDLGFFKRGELPEEFESVAFSMNVGEISPIFNSPYGYHILKLTEVEKSVAKPFESVRDDARQRMRLARRNEVTRELVARLRTQATITDDAEEAVVAHAGHVVAEPSASAAVPV